MRADRLSVVVEHADGSTQRWGPDELYAENIPLSLSCSTSVPGGFRDCTLSLPRRVDRDYPDLKLLDTIKVIGPGGAVAWEGRIQQFPRRHSDTSEITVGAVGWAAHLKDDPTVQLIGCDRRPDAWTEPPLARRLNLLTTDNPYATDYTVETNARSIRFDGASRKEIENGSTAEVWYTAPSGHLLAKGAVLTSEEHVVDTDTAQWLVTDLDDGTLADTYNQTAGAVDAATFTTARRYAYMRMKATSTHTKAVGNASHRTVKKVAVYEDHDITLTADPEGTEPAGLMASDLISHILSRWAPLLDPYEIETSAMWIPHFVIDEPTTAEDAIARANYADLREWGVWEDRRFFYRAANSERCCWEVRLDEGAHLDLEGEVADEVYNGVVVSYTEPNGESKTAGPAGSGCDAEDASLADTSPTNPVNAHGIARRWITLQISQPTTERTAIDLGALYLAEKAAPQRRGRITVTGQIQHPTAGKRPGWAVRAGDWVRLSDHPNDIPRRIIETNYTAGQTTMTLDNSAHRIEAILEALGIALVGRVG